MSEAYAAGTELKTIRELKINPTEIKISRMELVWEPSQESQNPYYPLWKATGSIRTAQEQTLGYMDLKGRVVSNITKAGLVEQKGGGF